MQLEPQQKEASSTGVEREGVVEGKTGEKKPTKTSKVEGKRRQIHPGLPALMMKKTYRF